jgi:hypothetical protein
MPDNPLAALMPRPPDPVKPVDPAQAVGMLGGIAGAMNALNINRLFNRTFEAESQLPAAKLRAQQIANDTALLEQRQKQTNAAFDIFGTLEKPTPELIRGRAALAARMGIPGDIIEGVRGPLMAARTAQEYASAIGQLRNAAIGSAGISTRVPGPPTAGGAPGSVSIAEANVGGGPGSMATGLPPGTAEAQKAEAESGQEAARTLQNASNEIPQQRTQLDLMRNDLKAAESKFGPTAKYEKTANVIANRVLGFHPTMSKEEIAGLESFDKVARQIALSQAGSLHATDQTLHTALGANPNTDLSAFGNENIINMLHGNADAVATKAKEWNKARRSGTGPDKFYQWSDQFNQSFDPRVFQFLRMDTKGRAALLRNIPDKAEFEKALVAADRKGWIKLPQ